jgi:hypothetical protein
VQVIIEVKTWGQAHHLSSILSDAEWQFRKAGLTEYADFFKTVARAVTKQARKLNEAEWLKRKERGNGKDV